jgi:predicted transcriptional regulator
MNMPTTKPDPFHKRTTVYFDKEVHDFLKYLAEAEDRSVSYITNWCCKQMMLEKGKTRPIRKGE